jgi:DNA-binding protein H-NS
MNEKEEEEPQEEHEEDEDETMDIYDEKQLEEMLENDEITEAEYSFMLGREKIGKKKKKKLGFEKRGHDDSKSVELAKKEYEED